MYNRVRRHAAPPPSSRSYRRHGRVSALPRWLLKMLDDLFGVPKPLPVPRTEPERGGGLAATPDKPDAPPRPETPEVEKKVLKVKEVDLQIEKNSEAHHTSSYELSEPRGELDEETGLPKPQKLVLRRGEDAGISIMFDRDYNKDIDDLQLALEYHCEDPRQSDGTRTVLKFNDQKIEKDPTKPRIESISGDKVNIRFSFPARSLVGQWKLILQVAFIHEGKSEKFWHKIDDIYVLFNPWCKDDPCFLDDDKLLQEYILNESGSIYYGFATWGEMGVKPRPWNYGQFDYDILPGVVKLLEKADLSLVKRGNPVEVTRMMAAMVNSNDEDGVLIGAWPSKEGDFGYGWTDGTAPMAWKGSVKILEEYFEKGQPVKYGQCWVFSGILTTVLRCLGIPARSITNFDSAHDSNGSCTIDKYYDKNNKYQGGDSIWNYHVWNEAWMARDDLRDGYGGWQAVDATPQEPSGAIWTCGPCPVDGIKHGNTMQLYDATFIFAEVNADVVYWRQDKDKEWKIDGIKKKHVGNMISTKEPNGEKRLDITSEYKYPEGSDEERTAVMKAVKNSTSFGYFSDMYGVSGIEDITAELTDMEELQVGKDAVIKVKVPNHGKEKRQVHLGITLSTMYYTGVIHDEVRCDSFDVGVEKGKSEVVTMTVPVEEYWPKVVDMCYFKVYCVGHVDETKQTFIHEDKFILSKPDIDIKAPSSVMGGEDFQVELSFTNPLHIALTKCSFTLEGAGIFKPKTLTHKPIKAGGQGRVILNVSAKRVGKKELIASFDSKELSDLSGSSPLQVK